MEATTRFELVYKVLQTSA